MFRLILMAILLLGTMKPEVEHITVAHKNCKLCKNRYHKFFFTKFLTSETKPNVSAEIEKLRDVARRSSEERK